MGRITLTSRVDTLTDAVADLVALIRERETSAIVAQPKAAAVASHVAQPKAEKPDYVALRAKGAGGTCKRCNRRYALASGLRQHHERWPHCTPKA
jgi:hypothetical protein